MHTLEKRFRLNVNRRVDNGTTTERQRIRTGLPSYDILLKKIRMHILSRQLPAHWLSNAAPDTAATRTFYTSMCVHKIHST